VSSCGGETTEAPLNQRLQEVHSDLQLGSRGPEVRALNEYLTKYGYFPNATLAERYPAWRPQVATPPADPSVFDERTQEAVWLLQASRNLPTTGAVDETTRAVLRAARCGRPDGIEHVDGDEKFASLPGFRDGKATWTVLHPNTAPPEIYDLVTRALAVWARQTTLNVTFTNATNANIRIEFISIDGPDGTLGSTLFPTEAGGGSLQLDSLESWSINGGPGETDLFTTILHELGHALGIDHSASRSALMWPDYLGPRTSLDLDDKVAVSVIYDTYGTLGTRKASDIASGITGALWMISREVWSDGFRVYKWGGSDWIPTDGGAVRIAVGINGIPWVVGQSGTIYRRRTTEPTATRQWDVIAGATASDIGIGGGDVAGPTSDGHVWIIGRNTLGDGGFQIYKYAGGSSWTAVNGAATKIAVGRNGVPWVTTAPGVLYRRTTNSPTTGDWETLVGTSTDVGLNAGTYMWGVAKVKSGEENVAVWEEQPRTISDFGHVAPARFQWAPGKRMGVGGPNCAITVGVNARPFMVDNNGTIWSSIDGAP